MSCSVHRNESVPPPLSRETAMPSPDHRKQFLTNTSYTLVAGINAIFTFRQLSHKCHALYTETSLSPHPLESRNCHSLSTGNRWSTHPSRWLRGSVLLPLAPPCLQRPLPGSLDQSSELTLQLGLFPATPKTQINHYFREGRKRSVIPFRRYIF